MDDPMEESHETRHTQTDDLSDEMLTEESFHVLHLPPGLDLLLEFLDTFGNDAPARTPEPVGPTPYPRTPTLN